MVFAYALLNVPEYRDESLAVLGSLDDVFVPDSFFAEFANVVWQWVAHRGVSLETGIEVLRDAEALVTRTYFARGLWEQALALAAQRGQPVYDTLFIALVMATGSRVITYDARLLERFPEETMTPSSYLGPEA